METLEGIIEQIIYQNEDNGYTVARLKPDRELQSITIVGIFYSLNLGQPVSVKGNFRHHPKYGEQFEVQEISYKLPTTIEGIRRYLSSGLIRGIGPKVAESIVQHFGKDTIDIIENHPERLKEIEGIGEKRVEIIKSCWEEHLHLKNIMLFLQSHQISTTYALKIYRFYGQDTIRILKTNPYRLVQDIWGVGFKIADRIAQNLGIEKNSPLRIKAGVIHTLESALEDGHLYLPEDELYKKAKDLLMVEEDRLPPALSEAEKENQIIREEDKIYLPPFYYAEKGVANRLLKINQREACGNKLNIDWTTLQERLKINFSAEQKEAIISSFQNKVLIITGGPGTGKTVTTLGIIETCKSKRLKVQLAAPTGRAAKRLTEVTGKEAKTIHRLLEYSPQSSEFQRNENHPLSVDMLILDEISMVDIILMSNLLKAMPINAHLILVGDADQLPSVGPGNVLRDMIAAGVFKVVHLTQIFRQAEKSLIVVNAHRINKGEPPIFRNQESREFIFFNQENPAKIIQIIRNLCTEILPHHFSYNPFEDVQVLCPMYKGEVGVDNLNNVLREILNPNAKTISGCPFRIGDKVMQIKNNYDKQVFNGDIGRVVSIDEEWQTLQVNFPEGEVKYDFKEMDQLILAYAVTVHKSQGCEFKTIIMPVILQHYVILDRNLLYTAITRAKEMVILIGTKKALMIAVKNNRVIKRYTNLTERLKGNST